MMPLWGWLAGMLQCRRTTPPTLTPPVTCLPLQELVRINGPADESLRLPNTLSISIKGLAAANLLQQLGGSLAASAGSACHTSDQPVMSSVLAAMRVEPAFAVGTLRLSTGRHTTAEEVDRAVALIAGAAAKQGMQLRTHAVAA